MLRIAVWISESSRNYQPRHDVFVREFAKHCQIQYEFINNTKDPGFTPDAYDLVFAHESDITHADMEVKLSKPKTARVVVFSGSHSHATPTPNYLTTSFDVIRANLAGFLAHYYKSGELDTSRFVSLDAKREKNHKHGLKPYQLSEIIGYLANLVDVTVLFADDDIPDDMLNNANPRLLLANDINHALSIVKTNKEISLAIIDIRFAGTKLKGYDICKALPNAKRIMLTDYGDYSECLGAWTAGADYFISKALFSLEHLKCVIELLKVKDAPLIIGNSTAMKDLWKRLVLYAKLKQDVLISGENGTGKELVAKAIYELSKKEKNAKFNALNCASVPENLFESILFGHAKGSFTGALNDQKGFLEVASNGLLFLDEIGDMPLMQQAKLLRVLQEKKFRKVGASSDCIFEGRVLYGTNRDLSAEVANGAFRRDLYYRMIGAELWVPPLRERQEDIAMLTAFFVYRFNRNNDLNPDDYRFEMSSEQLKRLKQYSFPGNIRELEKMICQACINAMINGVVQLSIDIPPEDAITPVSVKQAPAVYSLEMLCELLQNKVINSRGLPEQIKLELINHLISKEVKIISIAELLGMTEQSIRNFRSVVTRKG